MIDSKLAQADSEMIRHLLSLSAELLKALDDLMLVAEYRSQGQRMDALFPHKFKAARTAIAKARGQ